MADTDRRTRNPKRRAELLAVAARLFYEKGYDRTTLQDIADQIGFTKPAIYYYARNKEELLLDIYAQIVEPAIRSAREMAADVSGDGATRFLALIAQHLRIFLANMEANAVFEVQRASLSPQASSQVQAWGREYGAILADVYEAGLEDGSLVGATAPVMVNAVLGMCNSVHRWCDPDGELSIDEIVDVLTELIANGVTAR